jgi:hypothetical protein
MRPGMGAAEGDLAVVPEQIVKQRHISCEGWRTKAEDERGHDY